MTISILRRAAVILLRTIVVRIVVTIVVLTVGALVVLGILLTSSTGARWAVSALSEHVPGLSVGRVDGTLLRGLVLDDLRYVSGALDVELRRLVLEPGFAQAVRGRLVLERLEIEGGSINVPPATGPPPLPRIPEYLAIRSLVIANLAIDGVGSPILIMSAAATLDGPRLDLDDTQMRVGGVAITGRGALTVAVEALRGSLDARLTWLDGRKAGAPGASPPGIAIAADVVLAAAADPWFAAVEWSRLAWSDSPVGELHSPTGRLVVVPGAEPIAIELAAELEAQVFPDPASLTADASFAGDTLDLHRVALRAFGGEVSAGGKLSFAEQDGRFRIVVRGLDPSRFDARLAGRVDGRIDVTLGGEPVPRFFAAGELDGELHGELHGRRLDLQLRGSWSGHTLEVERTGIRLDDGSLDVAGRVTPESTDLRFEADVPRIESWYPAVHGALVASGAVRGDSRNPAITVQVDGRNLALDGAPIPPLDELSMTVDGLLAAHTVRLLGRSTFGVMRAGVRQGWDGEALHGTLLESTVAIARAGTWTLAAPAEYSVGAAAAEFERICYTGPARSRLCGKLSDEELSVTARELPSRLAEPWVPLDLELLGAADADLELDWRGPLRGSVSLHQPSLVLRTSARSHDSSDGATAGLSRGVEIVDLELQGVLSDERFQALLLAGLADSSDRLEAELEVEPPLEHGALSGRLVTNLTDLALLDAVTDGVRDVQGSVDVDVGVLGTPAAPTVRGTVVLRSLRASLPPLGVAVTRGSFSARAQDLNEVTFDGQLCTEGCVTFDGRLERPLAPAWRLEAGLAGERLELFDIPELRAVVTPDLELAGDSAGWRVTGTLGVDEAAAVISTVPRSALRPAPETVVHGGAAVGSRNTGGRAPSLALDVQARLGDVRFEGLGLAAELGGTVDLERTVRGQLLVQGTTEIEHGTFRVYGQEFAIERGLLIFTGQPDNPSLDIRATREVDDAQVGLAITGTANHPVSEVFADSAMSDSEALAQLMTGQSLAGAVIEDDALERVARNLGLQRIVPALDRLRTNIGLDELGMDRSSPGDGVLVAGERIGSDLLLCYKHGLFDDFTGLELIYGISDRFRLHTKTGSGQSIDLVYEVGPVDAPRPGCRRSRAAPR